MLFRSTTSADCGARGFFFLDLVLLTWFSRKPFTPRGFLRLQMLLSFLPSRPWRTVWSPLSRRTSSLCRAPLCAAHREFSATFIYPWTTAFCCCSCFSPCRLSSIASPCAIFVCLGHHALRGALSVSGHSSGCPPKYRQGDM